MSGGWSFYELKFVPLPLFESLPQDNTCQTSGILDKNNCEYVLKIQRIMI